MKKIIVGVCIGIVSVLLIWFGVSLFIDEVKRPFEFVAELFGLDTTTNIDRLELAQSWIYDLDFIDETDIEKLAQTNADLIVIDPSDVTTDDIAFIQNDHDTLTIGYLSIGQAESYRDYWKEEWIESSPSWIEQEDAYWEGNYNIAFWNQEWKDILFTSIDNLHEMGFDGIYLDTAGLDYWDEKQEAEGFMITLIEEISDYAKSKQGDFLIIPQNLGFMKRDYSLRLAEKIDAVGQEEVFYGYENEDGVLTPIEVTRQVTAMLDKYAEHELPIFTIDYPFDCTFEENEELLDEEVITSASTCFDEPHLKRLQQSYQKAWDRGFIHYAQNRDASGVTPALPHIMSIEESFDTVPVLSWNVTSANTAEGQSAYRVFVASSEEKLQNNEPDIYDSGRIWATNTSIGFIPDTEIKSGTYYWRVIVYEWAYDEDLVLSPWSEVGEFEYTHHSEVPIELSDPAGDGSFQAGWIPDWGFDDGFESLKQSENYLNSISPVWFEMNEDGTLNVLPSAHNEEFIEFCEQNSIELIPSIPLFDVDIFSTVLNEHLDAHVDAIYDAIMKGDYDGVDIDYEITYLDDKELYFTLLTNLADKLHEQDKKLVVTVLSKWSDSPIYSGFPETRQVQDWERIGQIADEVRIMAYDYTWQTVYTPGPISPLYWEEIILQYAVTKIPREKIVLALPLYGYSFRIDERSEIDMNVYEGGDISGSERRVLAYTYEEIRSLQDSYEMQCSMNSYSYEQVCRYDDGRYERDLYFEGARAIRRRRELAEEYGIKGVAYWRLGGDDEKSFR